MKKLAAAICLSSVILSGSWVHATQACFEGSDAFFRPFSQLEKTQDQATSIWKACEELNRPEMYKSNFIKDTLLRVAGNFGLGVMFGGGLASFSEMDKTPQEIAYKTALEHIKQIENPMERIRQVYALATSVQGFYDEKTLGFRTWAHGKMIFSETPENLLAAAQKNGTAGVCREFASLLQWSLIQVARHPSSTKGALSEKDFSSELITGTTPGGGHAWIRAHLPVYNEQGQLLGFNDFDLDTTWYPEQFSILYPRLSGIQEDTRKGLAQQCRQIRNCLSMEAAQEN